MKPNSRFLALTLAGTLAAAPVISSVAAFAETPAQPPTAGSKTTDSSASDKAVLTTVNDARDAMAHVHYARMALFNGDTELARKLTDSALSEMDAAQAAADNWAVPSKTGDSGLKYLPFDSSLSLAEDFVAMPDNAKALDSANRKLATGDSKGAVEDLKAGDIAVSVSAAMIPARDATEELRNAQSLMEAGKYYEAGMSLKAIEDMAVVDTWAADAVPEQPGHAKQTAQSTTATDQQPSATPSKS